MAYDLARRSRDTSNQNGALVLSARGVLLGEGFNDLPTGVRDLPERHERPEKYDWFRHAERHAIYDAAARGAGGTNSGTLICPWFACMPCGIGIIESRIRHVVGHQQRMAETPERWQANVDKALDMLTEAGVTWELYDEEIGGEPVLVNGEWWTP